MSSRNLTVQEIRELQSKVNRYLDTRGMDAVIAWSALMTYLKELKAKRYGDKNTRKYRQRHT